MRRNNFFIILFFVIFSILFYTENSYATCPDPAASLLGSGCHDMGNAYFNGEMTQYVNYGGTAVYSCSTNYISGCSGGSPSTSCPSNIATLLGSGCHDMGNAYFNGAMTQYVNYNGTAVYSCSTNYISGCSSGSGGGSSYYPPSVPSNLAVNLATNGTDAVLTWTDNSSDESEFKIYWRPQGGSWSYLSSKSYNETSFTYYSHPTGIYEYHINACNSYGCSVDSNTASVTVSAPAVVPTAPSNLTLNPPPGAAAIYLTWVDNSSNEDRFNLEREVSGSNSWSLLYQLGANVTSYTDTSVTSGTYYSYRVQACLSGTGCSAYSTLTYVSTSVGAATTTGGTNSAPTGVGIPYGSTSVSLGTTYYYGTSATDPEGDQIEFVFDWGDGQTTQSGLMPSGSSYQGSHAWSTAGTYSVRVKAKDSKGAESAWTSSISVVVGGLTGFSSSPTNLVITSVSSTQVNLSWTDNSTNETGFKIYRNLSSDPSWALIGTVGVNIVNFSDPGVTAGNSYNYHINSYNNSGMSGDSNWVYVSVPSSATSTTTGNIPEAPYNLRLDPPPGVAALYLKWNDNSSNEDKFNVERQISGSTNWNLLLQTGANATTYADTAITAGTYYSYRVQACRSGYGCSSYVYLYNVSTSGTPSNYPSTPTNLSASVISSSRIDLSWSPSTDDIGVTGYKVYRNGVFAASVTATFYSDTGLIAGMSYSYNVSAYDSQGNLSAWSNTLSATTLYGGTIATTTSDITSPYVINVGYSTESGGHIRVGASFSEAIDQNTLNDFNVYVVRVSDGSKVPGTVTKYPSGVDYLTSYPAELGVSYQLMVKKNVKDLAGNQMAVDYLSPAIQGGGTVLPSPLVPFAVDPYAIYPKQGDTNVDIGTRIRVKFTKGIDPASTVNQFFTLESSLSPGVHIPGSFYMYSDSFEYVPSPALQPGTSYTYKILTSLKDTSGNSLSSPFSAVFTTASGVSVNSATVSGRVLDSQDKVVVGVGVHIFTGDYARSYGLTTDSSGTFKVVIPEGEYFVEIFPPSARTDLLKPAPVKFRVSGGETKTLDLKFIISLKIITGTVTFPDGRPVTDAEVGAYSSENNQWTSAFTDSSGSYTLKVSGGKWTVGLRPKDLLIAKWSWSGPFQEVTFSTDFFNETQTINFIITIANSTLSVTTVDDLGQVIPNAGVVIDTVNSYQTTYDLRIPPEFKKSDSQGKVSFVLPGRTYYIRGFLAPELGFFNPSEQEVILPSNEVRNIRLVFKRQATASFMELSGTTRLDAGEKVSAFVWAWSERGGYRDTRSDSSGLFKLILASGEKWHLGAGKEDGGIPYKSSETVIDAGTQPLLVDLVLVKIQEAPLPSTVSVTQSAAQPVVAQVEDGAKMTMPASSAGSSGNISVEIRPTIEAPSQAAAQVVSTVYDVTVKDAAGKEITTFTKELEVTIPYDEKKLLDEGVSEKNIVPSFFEETNQTWVEIESYTVDLEKNVVVARVKHLTRFAIVAAADITPPAAPSGVLAKALGGGEIKISWVNPPKDYNHAKVYVSEKTGTLGKVLVAEISGAEFTDNTVKDGLLYYYIVRAVDPAGNESTNITQTSVIAKGTYVKQILVQAKAEEKKIPVGQQVKLEILRDLTTGSDGEDVKTLQQLLLDEGVYPQGLITGFFGDLTKQAVIRFQEKYADDILKPAGLPSGTGYVGPGTRKKLNSLSGVPVKGKMVPLSQVVKAEILHDLSQGTDGEDIKILQQLLLDEGVYPAGLITGYFGDLTKQAVIRFQEKYASDILLPVGLSEGTGYVGPATRKKINEILLK